MTLLFKYSGSLACILPYTKVAKMIPINYFNNYSKGNFFKHNNTIFTLSQIFGHLACVKNQSENGNEYSGKKIDKNMSQYIAPRKKATSLDPHFSI